MKNTHALTSQLAPNRLNYPTSSPTARALIIQPNNTRPENPYLLSMRIFYPLNSLVVTGNVWLIRWFLNLAKHAPKNLYNLKDSVLTFSVALVVVSSE
jgi:hypothetical protein